MNKPTIFLFSGQGTHYYQMGREFFEKEKTFKKWMLIGNDLFYRTTGIDLLKELYDENHKISELFNKTLLTHSAIFLFEYALSQVLLEKGIFPDYVLGASLGEFVAAAVSEALSFEAALLAVIRQAESLEQYCPNGGMLAILGPVELYQEKPIAALSELAGVNFSKHFVVSGKQKDLAAIEFFLKEKGVVAQSLAVSHGFHSSYIDAAKNIYLEKIKDLSLNKLKVPWISCSKAQTLSAITKEHLWDVVRQPILFQKTIQQLEAIGNYTYLDLGTSGTLATFVKYNLLPPSGSQVMPLLTPFGSHLHKLELIKATI